ncbi:fanconi anemia group M protein [Ceratobasidium sp. AG-Ba]|nr:fanconi anemia group M protein [Ceratobasidium sp. AG-Ba]
MIYRSKSVLRIPEIASIVSGFLEPRDAARLGRTNRHFFEIAMPVAWKHVESVVQVFKLVEGCTISHDKGDDDEEVTSIDLPLSISEKELTRLKIYAPLIKSLEVFGNPKDEVDYDVFGASTLLAYTESHVLLPNLQQLSMNTDDSDRIAYYFWFRVFASPSLITVCPIVTSPYRYLPYTALHVASALVKEATEKCPQLETLGLFVLDDSLSTFDDTLEHLAFDGSEQPLAPILAKAKQLVEVLGSSILLRNDIFLSLGELPRLARLEIFYEHDEEPEDDEDEPSLQHAVRIEQDGFQQLRHFGLHNATQTNVQLVWGISGFFKRTTSLVIEFNSCMTPSGESWVQSTFIPLLCEGSPHLNHLTIRFQLTREELPNSLFTFKLTEDNLAAMANLPLVTLNLAKTRFECDDAVKSIALAWPALEELNLPAQPVNFDELCYFAQYTPRLQDLGIELKLASLPQKPDLDRLKELRHPVLKQLESSFNDVHKFEPEQACALYRFLKGLFPNARLSCRVQTLIDLLLPGQKDRISIMLLNSVPTLVYIIATSSGVSLGSVEEDGPIQVMWHEREKLYYPSLKVDPTINSLLKDIAS